MFLINTVVILSVCATVSWSQIWPPTRLPRRQQQQARLQLKTALNFKNRIKERINQYRERNTQSVCYDIVGCFNLPHKNSPLQKVPESPDLLNTKFYLFTRETDLSKPDILYYEDNGRSINGSSFNASNPLKVVVHGYTSRWNEKGSMIMANIYLKMYDCNVILMDWYMGARGPNYPIAAANTELVGRQLGILLTNMVRNGLDPRKIHLIGFSLGAHVCGTASENLKNKGHLLGRITGLDPASPLFRNDYLREKYKKLDRSDAKLVDVIHTDSSPLLESARSSSSSVKVLGKAQPCPRLKKYSTEEFIKDLLLDEMDELNLEYRCEFVTDGFGLYEPIGHVDFFPNGGQDQPGCNDVKDSIVVSHFERGLSQDLVCSHVRAFLLYRESLQNLLDKKYNNKDSCEFIAFNCPREKVAFQEGSCFPQIANDSLNIDPSYRTDIGRIGEDVKGEGVMFLSTRGESQYCGTQIQASVELSNKSGPLKGILQIELSNKNHFKPQTFQMNCEFKGTDISGKTINGLGAMKYKSISNNLNSMQAKFNYVDTGYSSNNQSNYTPVIYFNKVMIRDMYGNSWEYCQRDTRMMNPNGPLSVTMTKNGCNSSTN